MKNEVGNPKFPIWLIGDSNPKNWEDTLNAPLDPRHPARHNIWTPILESIQRNLYKKEKLNFNPEPIYIRNAIENPSIKPRGNSVNWSDKVNLKIDELNTLINKYKPSIIFTFGSFSYEFVLRVDPEYVHKKFIYWGAKNLGLEFTNKIRIFDFEKTNIIPLLHVSISRGYFIESHNTFTGISKSNYFEHVGAKIADKFIEDRDKLKIWY